MSIARSGKVSHDGNDVKMYYNNVHVLTHEQIAIMQRQQQLTDKSNKLCIVALRSHLRSEPHTSHWKCTKNNL